MIELGNISIADTAAIARARTKLLDLAGALGMDAIKATRWATAVSEMIRGACESPGSSEAPRAIRVALTTARPSCALELVFDNLDDPAPLLGAAGLFEQVRVARRGGRRQLRCATAIPVDPAELSAEFIAAQRARIQSRSRAELMQQLRDKNRELERHRATLEARLGQLETIAYVTAHDLRGSADQAQYDAEELAEVLPLIPESIVRSHHLREIVANLHTATAQQVALLDGIDVIVGLWKDAALTCETFDASALLRARIAEIAALDGADIRIAELGQVTADPALFWIAISHLLDNALTYNDKSAKWVDITRTSAGLHIRDNGVGIPPDKLNDVLRIFQRLDSDAEGKGLGLTICEAIVQRHGWTLSIESCVGEGSTFTFAM